MTSVQNNGHVSSKGSKVAKSLCEVSSIGRKVAKSLDDVSRHESMVEKQRRRGVTQRRELSHKKTTTRCQHSEQGGSISMIRCQIIMKILRR